MTEFDPYLQWLGIPPHEQPPDHYRLLGLRPFESDPSTIQSATDQRMASVRQFQMGARAPFTQKLLNELAMAKLCLLDPYAKAEYDASLAKYRHEAGNATDALLPSSVTHSSTSASTTAQQSSLTVGKLSPRKPSKSNRRIRLAALPAILGMVAAGLITWWATNVSRHRESPQSLPGGGTVISQTSPPVDRMPSAASNEPVVIQQGANGFVILPAHAKLDGSVSSESREGSDFLIGWGNDEDAATWRFKVPKLPSQGIFHVRIEYHASTSAGDAEYVLAIDGEQHARDVRAKDQLVEDEFYLAVRRTGEHTLRFFLRKLPAEAAFALKAIEFSPPRAIGVNP